MWCRPSLLALTCGAQLQNFQMRRSQLLSHPHCRGRHPRDSRWPRQQGRHQQPARAFQIATPCLCCPRAFSRDFLPWAAHVAAFEAFLLTPGAVASRALQPRRRVAKFILHGTAGRLYRICRASIACPAQVSSPAHQCSQAARQPLLVGN